LALLKRGDSFGYEIGFNLKRVMQREHKGFNANIYPLLKKLEKERLIRSFWRIEDGVRPRRYYSILAKGIAYLEAKKEEADILEAEFKRVLNPYLLFPVAEDELASSMDIESPLRG
jgi:PadR family transcriptional regulator, regulatory protein PadR